MARGAIPPSPLPPRHGVDAQPTQESGDGCGPFGVMVASAERYTSTFAWPSVVPWLHTCTCAESCCPGCALAGPVIDFTVKSGRLPTPIRYPELALLSSISSIWLFCGSA